MIATRYEVILRRVATLLAVAIVTLSLLAAVTGLLLAFYYEPTAGGAYESLKTIHTEVANGWLIRSVHDIAGNGVIVVALLEIVVMFVSRQFRKSWLTAWVSGVLFTLSAIGLGWTAMVLDWNQVGFWRLKVELGTIEAIPFIGSLVRDIITGGSGINTTTVAHLYTLHSYVLSIAAIVLAVVHLAGLLVQEIEQKQGVRGRLEQLIASYKTTSKSPQETASSTPVVTSTGSNS